MLNAELLAAANRNKSPRNTMEDGVSFMVDEMIV